MTGALPPGDIEALQHAIASNLRTLGAATPYRADANEPDPRYLGYGVRAPAMKAVLSGLKPAFSALEPEQKITLATRLIASGYGEQKTVALALLEQVPGCFTPDRFDHLEALIRGLHGWSKIDAYTKAFLPQILKANTPELIALMRRWNTDQDLWLRRTSVVLFTRKVAQSGLYKDVALAHCNALIHDPEHLVQTGVGWCLRDLMRWHKSEILPHVMALRQNGVSSTITLYALRDIKGAERKAAMSGMPHS